MPRAALPARVLLASLAMATLAAARGAALAAPESAALPEDGAVRSTIDAECAGLADRALQAEPERFARIYGDRSDGRWGVADTDALARIARDPNIYSELAETWSVDGRVSVVSIAARSLEFRANAAYCYRTDGTLARAVETSTGGNTLDDEARYLDRAGRVVARSSRFAYVYPQPGATFSPDLRPATPDLYRTVDALPFYPLIAPQT